MLRFVVEMFYSLCMSDGTAQQLAVPYDYVQQVE